MKQDLCSCSIAELGRGLRQRAFSVREITEAHLARIDAVNPVVHAFILIDSEGARAAADAADRELAQGQDRGTLHGVPLTLKDLFATRAQRTTAGSRILEEHVTPQDAVVVQRLRQEGAIILGKTNLNEFAFGATGINARYGTVRNPWDTDRIVGGSSSGAAAAVAAGMCVAALGTDTGGSVRIPAALTGLVGFKPTYDRVPRDGVIPLSWTLDHVGVLSRHVADACDVFGCVGNRPPHGPLEKVPLKGLRIGVLEQYCSDLDGSVGQYWEQFLRAAAGAGARVVSLDFQRSREIVAASTVIMFAEAAASHLTWLRTCRELYGNDTKLRLLQGALYPAVTYLRAQQMREEIIHDVAGLFEQVDILACPTQPCVAAKISDVRPEIVLQIVRNTRLAPLLGLPALSVPLQCAGLPVGGQFVGPRGRDEYLLGVGVAVEDLIDTARTPAKLAAGGN
ncbi:MAG: amidase [Candidatus Binatia bacterium]